MDVFFWPIYDHLFSVGEGIDLNPYMGMGQHLVPSDWRNVCIQQLELFLEDFSGQVLTHSQSCNVGPPVDS